MDLDEIRREIAKFNLPLAGSVVPSPTVENCVLVSIYTIRDDRGRRSPSGKTLSELRGVIASYGADVEYLLIDEALSELEDGCRTSLVNSFPDIVRNSYTTVLDGVANVWVEKKRDISIEENTKIRELVDNISRVYKLRGAILRVTSDFRIATPTEFLRALRKIAPADCEDLDKELRTRNFSVPSLQWVNHRLDMLRKQGLIVRIAAGHYALTAVALQKLGTVKSRQSPDVIRLLALARRER